MSVSCTRAANVGSCPNVIKPNTMNTFGGDEVGTSAQHNVNLHECAALFLRGELSVRAYSRGSVNQPLQISFGYRNVHRIFRTSLSGSIFVTQVQYVFLEGGTECFSFRSVSCFVPTTGHLGFFFYELYL